MESLLKNVMSTAGDDIPMNVRIYVASLHEQYQQYVFTAKSFDDKNNYEFYEILGDATVHKFVTWYFSNRFTSIRDGIIPDKSSLELLTRLKIVFASKEKLAEMAEDFGFWPYIRADELNKTKSKIDLLEDVMEAFIGMTEYVVDRKYGEGKGYLIVKYLLRSYLDTKEITSQVEELKDTKSKFKEMMDKQGIVCSRYTYIDDNLRRTTTLVIDDIYVLASTQKNVKSKVRHKIVAQQAMDLLNDKYEGSVINFCLNCSSNNKKDADCEISNGNNCTGRRTTSGSATATATTTSTWTSNPSVFHRQMVEDDHFGDNRFRSNLNRHWNCM